MYPVAMLVASTHGQRVPLEFIERYDTRHWGIAPTDPDVLEVCRGPQGRYYWRAWVSILARAAQGGMRLHHEPGGPLWAVTPPMRAGRNVVTHGAWHTGAV